MNWPQRLPMWLRGPEVELSAHLRSYRLCAEAQLSGDDLSRSGILRRPKVMKRSNFDTSLIHESCELQIFSVP